VLTARAWWFLFWVGCFALVSVPWLAYYVPAVALISITLLLAFGSEAILFLIRTQNLPRRLNISRTAVQGGRVVPMMWAGVPAKVKVRIELQSGMPLSFVAFTETLPFGIDTIEGHRRIVTKIAAGEVVEIEYLFTPPAPGMVRFEGIEVRVADLMGFFYKRFYIRIPEEYAVLPPLRKEEGGQRSIKRFNSLPPPGIHRLKRAGSGGELLDLRDYRAGDPPKMIAWKASARRDRMITKEFESDVPVRSKVFLDASAVTRLGEPGRTPLVRMSSIAAGVAQAAAGNRDIVGLTVFDETETRTIKPARTRAHTMQLLRTLAEAAGRSPQSTETDPKILQRYAHSVAQELYPDLLDARWNTRPFGMFWIPLMDTRWSRLLILPVVLQALMFNLTALNVVVDIARDIVEPKVIWDAFLLLPVILLLMFAPMIMMGLVWILFGLRGFLPPRRGDLGRRKQLAAIYAVKNGDSAAAIERAIQDDAFFAERTGKFLSEHRRTPPPKLLDDRGRNRFRGESKLLVLANALQRTIGLARDNELYVIFLDPTDMADHLEPMLRAVRAARAKHHQVLVLLADPSDLPEPPEEGSRKKVSLSEVIRSSLADGYRDNLDRVRRELIRAGATLVKLDADDTIDAVLARLERIRSRRVIR
jgi:uncharacterized protein (DUF58 family)